MNVNGYEIKVVESGWTMYMTEANGKQVSAFCVEGDWFYQTGKTHAKFCGQLSALAKKSKAAAAIADFVVMH